MPEETYTPLFHEVLSKLSRIKSKKEKIAYLKQHNSDSLRMVIKASFPKPAKNSMGFNGISFTWYGKN